MAFEDPGQSVFALCCLLLPCLLEFLETAAEEDDDDGDDDDDDDDDVVDDDEDDECSDFVRMGANCSKLLNKQNSQDCMPA